MSWNDPGKKDDDGNGQDPWGKKDGPPDLDEAIRQFQKKLGTLFGGQGGGGATLNPKGSGKGFFGITLILIAIMIGYIVSGIFIVQPAEEAVITRFGRYKETVGAGPHWIPRLIDSHQIVNIEEVNTTRHGGKMLTMDENIVDAEIAVQYRISNPENFLFNMVSPDQAIRQVSDSALRAVVGQSTLDDVLTTGRTEIVVRVKEQIERVISSYGSGLMVSDLALQVTKPPAEVQEAFDDAIKAQQDEERFVNQAETYARQRIPIAEGKAKRILEEAQAYKERVILASTGETIRFTELLPEYRLDKQVMRDRLFLDSMQQVLSNTSKILVDVEGGNNLLYLPLDRLVSSAPKIGNFNPDQMQEAMEDKDIKTAQASNNNSRGNWPTYQDSNRYRRTRGG